MPFREDRRVPPGPHQPGDRGRRPVEREIAPPVVPHADESGEVERPPRPRRVDTPARRAALEEIQLRLERRDMAGALARLDKLLTEAPDDVELLCARGTLHAQESRFDRAAADLRRAARMAEHDVRVLVATGMLACKRARWRDAIDPLREAAALEPGDAAVQYYLGEAYNHVDELVPALTAYERAVELAPSNWRALKGVGVVLDRLGRPDEATEAYRRAREARTP
jgi:Flp pilus assembly protein TadD